MRLTRSGWVLIVVLLVACPAASWVSYLALAGRFATAPAAPARSGQSAQATALATATSPGSRAGYTAPSLTPAASSGARSTGISSTAAAVAPSPPAASAASSTAPGSSITVAYDAYAPYLPVRIAATTGIAAQRNLTLNQVPFGLTSETTYNEAARRKAVEDGTFDILLTTLDSVALFENDRTGKVIALIDESAGADKIVARQPVARLNDLRGKRIAYSAGSVSEFFLYASLGLAGLTARDVTLAPTENITEAVALYTNGAADALVGWEPNIGDALKNPDTKVVLGSDNYRAILDVIVVSNKALTQKPDAVQAFVDSWFAAVKLTTDEPVAAGQAVVASGDTDWTGVTKPADYTDQLALVAQATLGQNAVALQDPATLAGRIAEIQATWNNAGKQLPPVDPARLVENRFVVAAEGKTELQSSSPPANASFVLTSRIQVPKLTPDQIGQTRPVAELPLKFIQFEPDSATITAQSKQDLLAQVLPILKQTPGLYLKVEGMAAKPIGVSDADVEQTARDRTSAVISFLVGQGIDPNRLLGSTLKPEHPDSPDENVLKLDRKVVFILSAAGGR